MNINQQRTIASSLVISNIVEVASRVISQIAGNDIATSLNGDTLSGAEMKALIVSETRAHLATKEVQA
jgi:energy-converting hydrogenase Eha subunit G